LGAGMAATVVFMALTSKAKVVYLDKKNVA
jgi:hypothetical protein